MEDIKNTNNEQEYQLDFIKLFMQCLRKWYWFVLAVLVCVAIAVLYVKRQTPKYAVNGTIMLRVDSKGKGGTMLQSEMMDLMGFSSAKVVTDEIEILHSYGIMEQTVRALNLQTSYRKKQGMRWIGQYPTPDVIVNYPEGFVDTLTFGVGIDLSKKDDQYRLQVTFGRSKSKHVLSSLSEPVATCAGTLSFMEIHPLEAGDRMRIVTSPIAPMTDAYLAAINCSQLNKESNIIALSAQTDMPLVARDVINKMVELYNMDAVIDKNIIATNTGDFINERLQIITLELDTVEKAVEHYMKENGLSNMTEEVRLALNTKSDYQKRIADLETQINLLSYIQEYLRDPKNEHSLIPANLGVQDASLTALMKEYNDLLLNRMRVMRSAKEDNPLLAQADQQLAQLRTGIISSIDNQKEGLNISKNDVSRKDEQFSRLIRQVPAKERQYMEIKRQQEIKEKLFIYLYEKREENALALASTVMPAKIVNAPRISSRPVAPKKMQILLVALLLGCCIPLGIIYCTDRFNNEIQDRKEYQSVVKAPYLGEIIDCKGAGSVVVDGKSNTVQAEMFRTVRTNMKFMLPDKQCPIILVTSALNGEGKSFVSVNTALSMALLGKKVVLVGLDIRKPTLSKYLGLKYKGAVTSFLSDSSVTIDDLIVPSGVVDNMDVAPAGVIPPNPAELIQSPRMKELFEQLAERYDMIFVDTAPVSLVSDTFHLEKYADMTLFVTRANYTSREMLPYIEEVYEQKRLPNMACVLNGVSSHKSYHHYGYGHAYGYGNYGYGNYDRESGRKKK